MNEKQKRFVAEYLIDLNATKAAERAGYSEKTAGSQGHDLLKNPEIAAAIQKAMDKRTAKLEITAERVLNELAKLAFANMSDYIQITDKGEAFVDFSKLTPEQAAAIQEIRVDESGGGGGDGRRERVQRTTFKLADKGLNLERLGRHLKLFTDKVEVSGLDGLYERLQEARKSQ